MICCDKCEDWFHGSCVGVTKAIGQQMEEDGKEWVCPKCKKAERAMKGFVSPGKKIADISSCATSENNPTESETRGVSRPNVTKKGMQGGYKCDVYEEGLTIAKKTIEGVKKVDGQAVPKRRSISQECIALPIEEKKMDIPQIIRLSPQKHVDGRKECVVESCNKAPKADSIYCSNDCVLKHAQMSLKMLGKTDKVCHQALLLLRWNCVYSNLSVSGTL
ncbi:death-inducer obliterator 1-like isoform X1 [Homarus americanus]|uniref:death-inducer obliterator 1-like isoform X1 n=1 Tax=Homarus americanus TaxID=6706 RepID=UPI001C46747E|nr:death-inducer obliterator 1-like isoform X1 [Homarus americanus]